MPIRFRCPNGHRLIAEDRHAGRVATCRHCGTKVEVPSPVADIVSDTSVLRILGDYEPSKTVVVRDVVAVAEERSCPRCRASFAMNMRICPDCNLYLPPLAGGAASA
jgi:hypothetical protein